MLVTLPELKAKRRRLDPLAGTSDRGVAEKRRPEIRRVGITVRRGEHKVPRGRASREVQVSRITEVMSRRQTRKPFYRGRNNF